MRDGWRQRGWRVEMAAPEETDWDGGRLWVKGQEVSFVVNRSTDFFWHSEAFSALQKAYQAGKMWAYRGEIFLLSGRASCHPERLDLTPPGGWLPTYMNFDG